MLPNSRILASAAGSCTQPARALAAGRPAVGRDARGLSRGDWGIPGTALVASTFRCGGPAGIPRFVGVRVTSASPPPVSTSTSTPRSPVGYAALLGVALLWGSYTPALRYLFLADE
jgi:hypothetical protein